MCTPADGRVKRVGGDASACGGSRVLETEPSRAGLGAKASHAHVGIGSGRPAYRDPSKSSSNSKKPNAELKQLKQEKQALRKSPERKIGQVLLAPYRLPQKLVREVRKRFPKAGSRGDSGPASEYQQWLRGASGQERADRVTARRRRAGLPPSHCISIITPVFNTPAEWLTECVESVLNQIYENWELILIDDASTIPETLRLLPELAARDPRIVLAKDPERPAEFRPPPTPGSRMAQGEWMAFLDHDDFLEPDALFQNVKLLQDHPDADLIYSDEDKLTEQGFDAPIFKPDWSPDYFLSCNYVCHLTTDAARARAGGGRISFRV